MTLYSESIDYIRGLKNYIDNSENAEELYGQLYVSIGNKIRVTYNTVIKDKNGSIYSVLSNRQAPDNIISTMLNEGIKSGTKYSYSDILDALNLSSKEREQLKTIKKFNTILNNEILKTYNLDLESYNTLSDDKKKNYTFDKRLFTISGLKNNRTIEKAIKELIKYIPKSSNAAHMTVEKTMQYQDTTGNFIGYIQNNREEYFKNLRNDVLYNNKDIKLGPIYTLPALDRDNDFEVVQVIGYDDQVSDIGTTIGKLDNKLTAEILLSMHKKNSYPVPVPGDSGNMVFVNNIVPETVDIDKELYNLMLFEKNRIESIVDRNRGVKSYATNGSEYVIFKAIDKILKKNNQDFNENTVRDAFNEYFETSVGDFTEYLKNLNIIDNDGKFMSKLQGFLTSTTGIKDANKRKQESQKNKKKKN
jgi:hypothetical protein